MLTVFWGSHLISFKTAWIQVQWLLAINGGDKVEVSLVLTNASLSQEGCLGAVCTPDLKVELVAVAPLWHSACLPASLIGSILDLCKEQGHFRDIQGVCLSLWQLAPDTKAFIFAPILWKAWELGLSATFFFLGNTGVGLLGSLHPLHCGMPAALRSWCGDLLKASWSQKTTCVPKLPLMAAVEALLWPEVLYTLGNSIQLLLISLSSITFHST